MTGFLYRLGIWIAKVGINLCSRWLSNIGFTIIEKARRW